MQDEIIKKAILLKKDFPKQTSNNKYIIRYRVVSEDGQQNTQWTPFYTVSAATVGQITNNVEIAYTVISDGSGVRISWDVPEELSEYTFDVYLNWSANEDTWLYGTGEDTDSQYKGSVLGNTFYSIIPEISGEPAGYVKALVQIPTLTKTISQDAILFASPSTNTAVVPPGITQIDGGSIA
jgi:hypothetical protein